MITKRLYFAGVWSAAAALLLMAGQAVLAACLWLTGMMTILTGSSGKLTVRDCRFSNERSRWAIDLVPDPKNSVTGCK